MQETFGVLTTSTQQEAHKPVIKNHRSTMTSYTSKATQLVKLGLGKGWCFQKTKYCNVHVCEIFRNWFAKAASYKKKNIVIVIDHSGSMASVVFLNNGSQLDRMTIAKDAAMTVLETFNTEDYVSSDYMIFVC